MTAPSEAAPAPLPEAFRARVPFAALVLDLDGTLLDPQSLVTPRAAAAVRRLADGGVRVILNTGRALPSAERFWRELGLDTPLGVYNGGKAQRPGHPPLYERHVPADVAARVAELAGRRGWQLNFYHDDTVYSTRETDAYRWYRDTFRLPAHLGDEADLVRRPNTKLLVIVEEDRKDAALAELAAHFGDTAHVTSSGPRFVEVMPPGVDKSLALRAIADELGVPLDRTVAAGDGENDIEMLRRAGLGVSVATGHPATRAAADWIVPPLWEDGLDLLAREAFLR